MSFLSDWYFTVCLNLRAREASEVIAILDALETPGTSPQLAAIAIAELGRCDVGIQVYALPKLVRLGRERAGPLRDQVERTLADMVATCEKPELVAGLEDLALFALRGDWRGKQDPVAAMEAVARQMATGQTPEDETVPYLGLPALVAETVFLAGLETSAQQGNFAAKVVQRMESGECPGMQRLLRQAQAGTLGRLAALQATAIARSLEGAKSGTDLALALVRLPGSAGLLEPDIGEACAHLIVHRIEDLPGRIRSARKEFDSFAEFHVIRRAATSRTATDQVALRLCIPRQEVVPAAQTIWEAGIVAACLPFATEPFAKTVSRRWGEFAQARSDGPANDTTLAIWHLSLAGWLGVQLATRLDPAAPSRCELLRVATRAEWEYFTRHTPWLRSAAEQPRGSTAKKPAPTKGVLPGPVTGLILFVRFSLKELATRDENLPLDAWLEAAAEVSDAIQVLNRWAGDVFMGPPDDDAVQRWQKDLPRLIAAAGNMKNWRNPERQLVALLQRFCLEPPELPRENRNWWEGLTDLEALRKMNLLEDRLARRILAFPPPASQDWITLDWLCQEQPEIGPRTRLAARLERFLSPDAAETQHLRPEWERALAAGLAQVFVPDELDRWARQRLLAVVRHPASGDAGRFAVQLLVQLGRPVDIAGLVSTLLLDNPPDLAWRLQYTSEGLAARAAAELRSEQERTRPKPPRLARRGHEEAAYWLHQGATLLALCPGGETAQTLRTRFTQARAARYGLHRPAISLTQARVEPVSRRPMLVVSTSETNAGVFPWMIEQVIEDRVHGHFALLYSRYWLKDGDGHKRSAAIVVGEHGSNQKIAVETQTGRPVVAPLAAKASATGRVVLNLAGRRLAPAQLMPGPDGCYRASGRRTQHGCEFEVDDDIFSGRLRQPPPEWWDVDEAWAFELERPTVWKNLVLVQENRTWKPARQELSDLIAQEGGPEVPFTIQLTFVAVERGRHEGQVWLFSTGPGRLYELRPQLFTPDSAGLLQKFLDRGENNIRGLRVRVTALRDAEGRLRLGTTPEQIDRLNLDWRDLFLPGMAVTAVRPPRSSRFFVPTGAPAPFPPEVEVWWEGEPLRPGTDRVTGVVTGWSADDRRRGQVRLEPADVMKLRASQARRASLHAELAGLAERDLLTLTRTFGEPRELGNVLAVTADGLGVQVAAESLNLLADKVRFIPAGTSRQAIVVRLGRVPRPDVVIEFSAQNLAPLRPGEHVGIVFEVPNQRANHHVCQVLFVQDGVGLLVAANLRSDSPNLGSKVFVTVQEGAGSRGKVENLMVVAEALYSIRRVEQPPPDACFVGTYVDKAARADAWVRGQQPGELLLGPAGLRRRLFETPRPVGNQATAPWPTADHLASNIAGTRVPPDFENRLRDVHLLVPGYPEEGDEVLLAGWCPGLAPVSRYAIQGIELRSLLHRDGLHRVRRIFQGRRTEEAEEEPESGEVLDRTSVDRTSELAKLEAEGRVVPAQVVGSDGPAWRVLLPWLKARRFSNREATLEVPASELHHFPHARGVVYNPEDARVTVMQVAGNWQASFRGVPAVSLEHFQEESGKEIGEVYAPPCSLVFVGHCEGPHADTLRFEYGFGRVLEVDQLRVRIDRGAKGSIKTILFHGDRLKSIKFVHDEQLGLCLDVLGVDIAFGDAHHVFLQASRHRFVHTLVLEAGPEREPRIVAIKGFNEGGERPQQEFSIPAASLSSGDRAAWSERLAAAGEAQLSTYARLNTTRFAETHGQVSEFQAVPFSFGTPGGLRQGDRLLVEAGVMKRTRSKNDVWLALHPLPGVDGRAHAEPLGMLRRDFSVRESLLPRFLGRASDTSDALQGMIFAVMIMNAGEGSGRANLLSMPPRRAEALPGVLSSSAAPVFATTVDVKQLPAERRIRLEVRPGVFFELLPTDLDGKVPEGLAAGTLVRLEPGTPAPAGTPRVRLTVCQFSSWRYLSPQMDRPGTVLPIDRLLDERARDTDWNWSSEELFTAPDFAVKFVLEARRPNEDGADMGKFMSLSHPKFAWLGRGRHRGGHDEAVFFPAENFQEVGFLLWGSDADIRMARPRGGDLAAAWHLLSFADVSIATLKQRCEIRRWFVHDHATGRWTRQGIAPLDLGELSVRTGPLFFDPVEKNGDVRLRYEVAALPRLGTPLGNIADAFGLERLDGNRVHHVAVAAVQKNGGHFEGVWVEWVPGRVIELPVALLSWRSGPEVLPLSGFDWAHLACGDELVLRLVAGDTLAPDFIEVVAWHRGPRGSCIPSGGRALLPYREPVPDGGARFGAGAFQLTLPVAIDKDPPVALLLAADNRPEPFDHQRLRPGDTVLLQADADGVSRLGVAGWPEMEAKVSLRDQFDWSSHPFTEFVAANTPLVPAFIALVRATGGALPVTVEHVDASARVLYFSFREQPFRLAPGRISQALVLGATDDQQYAAVWLGRGVSFLPADELVAGVTPITGPAVLQAMIAQSVPVWVRAGREEKSPLAIGLVDDVAGDLWVVPILVCRPEHGSPGLLVRACKSQRLYWIPREYLAWADLTESEIDSLLVAGRPLTRAFRARLKFTGDGFPLLSLLDTVEARREESELLPGRTLTVEVVTETQRIGGENSSSWLVRSRDTGLLLRCDVPAASWLAPGTPCLVEISHRRFEQTWRVACTPYGLRQVSLNLPESVIGQIQAAKEPRPAVSTWRDELIRCSRLETAELHGKSPGGTATALLLIQAWELCLARNAPDRWAAETALLWLKEQRLQPNWQLHEALLAAGTLSASIGGVRETAGAGGLPRQGEARLVDDCWEALTTLLAEIHRRLIRSQHLAVLLSRLSREQLKFDSRFQALHARLTELVSHPLTPAGRGEILRLAEQLMMDPGNDRHQLGGALMACLGMVPPPQAMAAISGDRADELCLFSDLARVCAPFADWAHEVRINRSDQAAIAEGIIPLLRTTLEKCRQLDWDMTLLESLPPLINR